jgi:hypothetical protein
MVRYESSKRRDICAHHILHLGLSMAACTINEMEAIRDAVCSFLIKGFGTSASSDPSLALRGDIRNFKRLLRKLVLNLRIE